MDHFTYDERDRTVSMDLDVFRDLIQQAWSISRSGFSPNVKRMLDEAEEVLQRGYEE